ncbi:hypothetical protein [Shewanella sp. MEBiC00475]|nr:hypothetical protein [Shewanella sp. MEBiC00475]
METHEQQRFDFLYEQHLTNLTLQGKRPATKKNEATHKKNEATHFLNK